ISDTASTTAIPTMDIDRRARTPAEEKANAPGRARTSRYGWSIRPFSQRRPTSGHRIRPGAGGSGERGGHQVLRGLLHLREVLGRHERLRVHLVDVLGPGRPRREPCVLRGDLQPADGRTVSGRRRQPAGDLLAGERRRRNLARAELGQSGLLLAGGRRLLEVPVGFKWFVPGLLDGSVGFGGEESAGASFLRQDGTVWTCLLYTSDAADEE